MLLLVLIKLAVEETAKILARERARVRVRSKSGEDTEAVAVLAGGYRGSSGTNRKAQSVLQFGWQTARNTLQWSSISRHQ